MGIQPGLLAAMLKAGHLKGVIRWKVDLDESVLSQELPLSGQPTFRVDSDGATNLDDVLGMFAVQLRLSEFSSLDLSNVAQALASLPDRFVIAWTGWQSFAKSAPQDADVIVSVFEDVTSSASGTVLVLGKTGNYPHIGELQLMA